jgi:hypothetical protein
MGAKKAMTRILPGRLRAAAQVANRDLAIRYATEPTFQVAYR